jgi:hypothetical protein
MVNAGQLSAGVLKVGMLDGDVLNADCGTIPTDAAAQTAFQDLSKRPFRISPTPPLQRAAPRHP